MSSFDAVATAVQKLLMNAPAIAVAAVKDGELVYSHAAGSIETGVPADVEGTVFMVASISKTMNGLLCMLMKESGELDLDKDISEYTGTIIRNPYFAEVPVTARHLLWHTSSLKDDESAVNSFGQWKTSDVDCTVGLEAYVLARLMDPGSARRIWSDVRGPTNPRILDASGWYNYSNAGATLLEWVLEKVASVPYAQLVQTRIFDALGMARSKYTLFEAQQLQGASLAVPQLVGHYGVAEVPAAGLRTTAGDLARFLAALTNPCRCPISAESLSEMLPDDGFAGLGWWGMDFPYGESRSDECVFAHGGLMEGVRTHIYIWPKRQAGAVILTNSSCDYSLVASALKKAVLEGTAQRQNRQNRKQKQEAHANQARRNGSGQDLEEVS